ncbi:GntR family transcriptional regulator [Psychromarinibacter sediminicola]|nr:GntR family transcriptional regulator [Psychromarinibacter sediminicola]
MARWIIADSAVETDTKKTAPRTLVRLGISYNIAAGRTRRLESAVRKTPVERQKLSGFAREQIRSRIISGEFPMGRKLPEAELVRLLGMSKSPIREALLRQCQRNSA